MSTPVIADPVIAARNALAAQSAITALVGQRIYYAIPAPVGGVEPTYPLLVLSLVDDDELRPETLTARVQVDVWGTGSDNFALLDCKKIAATVRSVARDLRGAWPDSLGGPTAYISNSVAGQIIPNPDSTSGRARFVVDLQLEVN